jgi:hypothetical protein
MISIGGFEPGGYVTYKWIGKRTWEDLGMNPGAVCWAAVASSNEQKVRNTVDEEVRIFVRSRVDVVGRTVNAGLLRATAKELPQ